MNQLQTKPRYELLDGLRGVAALLVIIYHSFECFAMDTWLIGHGYLAVDFFFILSGFVIGYAYDDRWPRKRKKAKAATGPCLTVWGFFRRRLIRLHPMVVLGVVWGLVCYLLAGGIGWDGTKATTSALMLATLFGLFLIPATPGSAADVRGNQEMYSLNGPHWSLFFEYIGNVFYALFIRRFSTRVLGTVTAVLGVLFVWFFVSDVVGYGNIGVGWTLDGHNFWGGLLRMSFSYSLGLLLSRAAHAPLHYDDMPGGGGFLRRNAFWVGSLLITAFLFVPCLGTGDKAWMNCVYEVYCVVALFPAIVCLTASGATKGATARVCNFFGEISYPLYAIHYPTMYIFYKYIGFPDTFRTPAECWWIMLALIAGNILFAYLVLRFYDRPLRRWLTMHTA